MLAVTRKMLFVRAPAELARLRAFADEAVDRPGVDELTAALRGMRRLRVALGAMDHLDAQFHCQTRPLFPGFREDIAVLDVARQIDQGLLDPVRNQSRVGAVRRDHRRPAARILAAQRQDLLAQTVVGAAGGGYAGIGVTADPRLDAGIE